MALHNDFEAIASERVHQLEWLSQMVSQTKRTLSKTNERLTTAFHVNDANGRKPCLLRRLLPAEMHTMQSKHCSSSDWSKILLLLPAQYASKDQSSKLLNLVTNSRFEGFVVLILDSDNSVNDTKANATKGDNNSNDNDHDWINLLPYGVHDCSVIADCILHVDTARVYRCSSIQDSYIQSHAVLMNCGTIQCNMKSSKSFPVLEISVGPETGGGRPLLLHPESTMIDVCRQLAAPSHLTPSTTTEKEQSNPRPCLNVIGRHSVVLNAATIDTVYLHERCRIDGGGCVVRQTVMFPHSTIGTACTVQNVVLQWKATVSHNSTVSDTLVMEESAVGPHGTVVQTVLGPDVHVSNGEVHCSILGPNCNAHHQSLLLAVMWPTGRGNVGYGANVGSNHTGRIPDQECAAGEGTFWGLSCVIKFPLDLSSAPYSVVAAGTTMAPQRCTMPFSLIVSGNNGFGTSIIPGWVWKHSPYTIVRSEHKFATRRKAVRHAFYTGWKILRPETIQLVVAARSALQSVDTTAKVYDTDRAIPGIGQSQLTEAGRLGGIQAYTECIQRFALQGLFDLLLKASEEPSVPLDAVLRREVGNVRPSPAAAKQPSSSVSWPTFPWDADQSAESFWKTQRILLVQEFPISTRQPLSTWAHALLLQYLKLETAFAQAVYKCKQRDDVRGVETIPDYTNVHVLADQDPVIVSVQKELQEKQVHIQSLLAKLNVQSRL